MKAADAPQVVRAVVERGPPARDSRFSGPGSGPPARTGGGCPLFRMGKPLTVPRSVSPTRKFTI